MPTSRARRRVPRCHSLEPEPIGCNIAIVDACRRRSPSPSPARPQARLTYPRPRRADAVPRLGPPDLEPPVELGLDGDARRVGRVSRERDAPRAEGDLEGVGRPRVAMNVGVDVPHVRHERRRRLGDRGYPGDVSVDAEELDLERVARRRVLDPGELAIAREAVEPRVAGREAAQPVAPRLVERREPRRFRDEQTGVRGGDIELPRRLEGLDPRGVVARAAEVRRGAGLAAVERDDELAARRQKRPLDVRARRAEQLAVSADVLLARRVREVEDDAVEAPERLRRRRVDAVDGGEPVRAAARVAAVELLQRRGRLEGRRHDLDGRCVGDGRAAGQVAVA